jgi:hypothetical protein
LSSTPAVKAPEAPKTTKIVETYEFAGEKVQVTKTVPITASAKGTTTPTKGVTAPPKKGNLNSILSGLNQNKKKLSTLEKSKYDWSSFKEEEGIEDELNVHLKSKDRYS